MYVRLTSLSLDYNKIVEVDPDAFKGLEGNNQQGLEGNNQQGEGLEGNNQQEGQKVTTNKKD